MEQKNMKTEIHKLDQLDKETWSQYSRIPLREGSASIKCTARMTAACKPCAWTSKSTKAFMAATRTCQRVVVGPPVNGCNKPLMRS